MLAKLLTFLVFDPTLVNDELVDERWQTLQTQNPHVLSTMAIPDLSEHLSEI